MTTVAFISDLHLSEETVALNQCFSEFLSQAISEFTTLYILGDFFADWAGDDLMNPWHLAIAEELKQAQGQGLSIYFLPGNRDFLIGERFLHLSGMKYLADPTVITLNNEKVLLKHGDDLCTGDKLHQLFHAVTRGKLFKWLFLKIPGRFRRKIVSGVRGKSQQRQLPFSKMQCAESAIVKSLQRNGADRLICGHTHQPMISYYHVKSPQYAVIILPDWGKNWGYLCYNQTHGYALQIKPVEES